MLVLTVILVILEKSPNITNLTIQNDYFYPLSAFNAYDRDSGAPGEKLKVSSQFLDERVGC